MKNIVSILGAATLGGLLSACGGGASGTTPPAPSNGASHAAAPAQAQSVSISINIPGRTPAAVRRATYVGAGTQSAVITVTPGSGVQTPNPATTTVNCTSSCQATLSVYPGSNTFAVSLYDGTNGTGFLLSAGSTTSTIVAGPNAINLTFNGVPFAVVAVANPLTLPSGTAGSTTLTVNALDADMNTIVGPGTYTTPITLASSFSHVALSPTTLNGPAQTSVTATYDGTAVPCNTSVLIAGTIGSVTGPAGGLGITTGVACGITLTPSALTVASGGGTGTVTVTDPGFSGTITASSSSICLVAGNATISPSSAPIASATFTVTGQTSTAPASCPITFTDGTNTATLLVSVM